VVCAINVVAGIIEQQAFMDEMTTRIPLETGKVGITEVWITNIWMECGCRILCAQDFFSTVTIRSVNQSGQNTAFYDMEF